eukprot:s4868_g8.t1
MASKLVKKKPKSFKAVYEDNPKGPTALKNPLMPWPPGTPKGESKGGEKKHDKKDKKKDDNGKGGKDDVGKDDAVPTYHQKGRAKGRAESVGCPRTLLEATQEWEDYVQWELECFGAPADPFDLFFQHYPKAVQSQLLNEYARSTKE